MRSGVGIQRSFYSSPALGIQPSTTFIGRQFPRTNLRRERRTPRPWQIMASIQKIEIRVCVNRTCNRMGSREILATLSDIAPPAVTVKSCGCLGLCGAGPNLALLPSGTLVRHCATPAKAADVLAEVCGSSREGARKSLEALALRKKAEALLQERGNPSEALALLRQAIDLKPLGGLHLIYKTRSVAKLTLGDAEGALEDANEALKIDPRFHLAYICQADSFLAMGEWAKSESAFLKPFRLNRRFVNPSGSMSVADRITKLQENWTAAHDTS